MSRLKPPFSPPGEPAGLNWFRCNQCGGVMVTVDLEMGSTPAYLACRLSADCRGQATSAEYPSADDTRWSLLAPTRMLHGEWRRSRLSELRKLTIMARRSDAARAVLDHLQRGGLVLRAPTAHGLSRAAKLSGDSWEPGQLFSRPNDELLPGRGGTA